MRKKQTRLSAALRIESGVRQDEQTLRTGETARKGSRLTARNRTHSRMYNSTSDRTWARDVEGDDVAAGMTGLGAETPAMSEAARQLARCWIRRHE
jgi:hypothetical protein